jgi:hypothetical protein
MTLKEQTFKALHNPLTDALSPDALSYGRHPWPVSAKLATVGHPEDGSFSH